MTQETINDSGNFFLNFPIFIHRGKNSFNAVAILVFMILFFSAPLSAQENLKFKHLTTKDGLLTNFVQCFAEDKYGFLWIGGEGGLTRYDGNNFVHFNVDPFDSTSLPDPVIKTLFYDSKSRLWLGTSNKLVRFDYNSMSFHVVNLGLDEVENTWVNAIAETCENEEVVLWFGVMNFGLVKYYPDKEIIKYYKPNPDDSHSLNDVFIFNILVDDNVLWLGTYKGGLNKFNTETEDFTIYKNDKSTKNSISDNHIIALESSFEGEEKVLWLVTGNKGFIKFYPDRNEFVKFLPDKNNPNSLSHYRVLCVDHYKDKLLLGTAGGGLNIFNPVDEKIDHFFLSPEKGEIASEIILSIFQTNSGLVLFGTYESGISYFDSKPVGFDVYQHDINNENSISAKSVISISGDQSGNIYLGHSTGLDILRNNQIIRNNKIPMLNTLLKNIIISSLCSSKKLRNTIWIGTFNNGLIKYNFADQSIQRFINDPSDTASISHNTVMALYEDSEGYLWFGGPSEGLNRMDVSTGLVKRYKNELGNEKSLSNNFITSIYEDSQGTIWIGTEAGLNSLSKSSDDFERISLDEKGIFTNTNYIGSVCDDPVNNDILWIGSAAGLIKLNINTKQFKRYTINDGLPSNLVISVINDFNNSIWMSTTKGISKINVTNNAIINFDESDGVDIQEFILNCIYKDMHGQMYFGGNNGLISFHPDSIKITEEENEVVLTDFYLLNKLIKPGKNSKLDSSITVKKKLTLDYSDYVFGLEFTAPDLRSSEKLNYQYMLAGFHNEWIQTPKNNRIVTFTNIPPGEYEFMVRKVDRFGGNDENYKTLLIEITPPYWATWWAYLMYGLIFFGAIFGFIEYRSLRLKKEKANLQLAVDERTRELKKLNADKDRFFSIVAHDIKSPLVALVKFTEIFKRQYKNLSEEERIESISEMNDTLNNSYRYLTNLLNWSRVQIGRFEYNPVSFELMHLIEENIEYILPLAQAKQISIKSDLKNEIVYADYEMVSIILRNLLSNAVKFSRRDSEVKIYSVVQEDVVIINVEDKGVGIDHDKLQTLFDIDKVKKTRGTENEDGTGLGLILCAELIKKNNGRISAESNINEGSKFSFKLPLTDKHNMNNGE